MLMDQSLGVIMAVGALLVGILVLTGNGDFFLRGGKNAKRDSVYIKEKMDRASGILLLVFGVLTGIDCLTTGVPLKIAYAVGVVLCFAVYLIYLRTKCRRK